MNNTQPYFLQSRKPGPASCILYCKNSAYFTVVNETEAGSFYFNQWNGQGVLTTSKQTIAVNNEVGGSLFFITKDAAKNTDNAALSVAIPGSGSKPIFMPAKFLMATILLYPGVFSQQLIFRWSVTTLNLQTSRNTPPFSGFQLITQDCEIQTVNVSALVFDNADNAEAFVNSLPDTDPSRTLNLDSTMDSAIKNAMTTAAQAKGWTVNETEMSQAQQSANNITEQQAEQTTVATPSQEDTQQQA